MRKLLAVCVVLVVFLGITTGILWRDLRAERQLASDQREQMSQAKTSDLGSAQPPPPQPTNVVEATPVAVAQIPDPMPVIRADPRVLAPTPVPVSPAAAMRLQEMARAEVMRQADETATGKVLQWRDKLTLAGQTLTTEQLQALNAASLKETRLDAEESLAQQQQQPTQPMDQEAMFRMREENLNRANELNLRILEDVRSQLPEALVGALRTQFETGHKTRLDNLHAEEERAKLIGR
jgi:hypothetical protein